MSDRILWNRRPTDARDGGDIDELVITNCMVHVEQMDDRCWWIGVSRADGSEWSGNFTCDARGRMSFWQQENHDIKLFEQSNLKLQREDITDWPQWRRDQDDWDDDSLTDRLRNRSTCDCCSLSCYVCADRLEAADEIERLRAEVAVLRDELRLAGEEARRG